MSIAFDEFPASYRYCQKGMAATMSGLMVVGFILKPKFVPPVVRKTILSLILVFALGVLLLSNYVIIKYPYLSLVEPADGDPFTNAYASHGSCLYKVMKMVAWLTAASLVVSLSVTGVDTVAKSLILIYALLLLLFLTFFILFYNPVSHPTIATFIRTTFGFGIVLFPFFIVSIAIGSIRCGYLLSGSENNFEMSPSDTDD